MLPTWLTLIVVGLIVYALSVTPVVPLSWKLFIQWIGGILLVVGVILLVFVLLHIPLPG